MMNAKNQKSKTSNGNNAVEKMAVLRKYLQDNLGKAFHLEGRYDAVQDVLYANEERHDITVKVLGKEQPINGQKYQVLVGIDSLPPKDRYHYYKCMRAFFDQNSTCEELQNIFIRHAGRRIPFHQFITGHLGGGDLNLGGFLARLSGIQQKIEYGMRDVHLKDLVHSLRIPRYSTVAAGEGVQKTFAFLALLVGGAWLNDRHSFFVMDKERYSSEEIGSQGLPVFEYELIYDKGLQVQKGEGSKYIPIPTLDEITTAFGDIRNYLFPIGVLSEITKLYGELLTIYSALNNTSREEIKKLLPSQGLLELAAQQRLSK